MVRDPRATWLLRAEADAWLTPLLRSLGDEAAVVEGRVLAGGRGGSRLRSAGGHDVVVRHYRRGGWPAALFHDTYWGRRPRPFRELCVTEALRAAGAPVVEVYGAAVHWVLPVCYRGWLVTRYVAQARTLWEWASAGTTPDDRQIVLPLVGRALRRLHDAGGRHPDLNLNNILLAPAAVPQGYQVLFIDFDIPLRLWQPTADLARLRRSARKLDPAGVWLRAADLECLAAAYRS
jgi:lipopolysaccharide kinase (Kdo/WaaP) family protein